MDNNDSQEANIVLNSAPPTDYYTTTDKKVGDFLLGFFGMIILALIYGVIYGFAYSLFFSFLTVSTVFVWINIIISIAVTVFSVAWFFKTGRRFIAIGIISIAIIPFLLLGSCLVIFSVGIR